VLAILSFSYTSTTSACSDALLCVHVGDRHVAFAVPAIDCDAPTYRHVLLPFAILLLLLYVMGLPLALAALLAKTHKETTVKQHARLRPLPSTRLQVPPPDAGEVIASIVLATPLLPLPSNEPAAAIASAAPTFQDPAPSLIFLVFFPLLSAFGSSMWYWPALMFVRRAGVQALFASQAGGVSFRTSLFLCACLHLTLTLLHATQRPYRSVTLQRAELAVHALLLLLAMSVATFPPPYPPDEQVALAIIIVPTSVIFMLLLGKRTWRKRHQLDQEHSVPVQHDPLDYNQSATQPRLRQRHGAKSLEAHSHALMEDLFETESY
jgi:hypothetical protein